MYMANIYIFGDCMLHNWQRLMKKMAHKSIENSTAFFFSHVAFHFVIVLVRFFFFIVCMLCAAVRTGATVTVTRAA